jgi:hypothetical protein
MKLEVGDYVRIEPLSDEKKHNYPFGWVFSHSDPYMNMDKFVGKVTRISRVEGTHRCYLECDGGQYMWSSSHLKRIRKSDNMLF